MTNVNRYDESDSNKVGERDAEPVGFSLLSFGDEVERVHQDYREAGTDEEVDVLDISAVLRIS